VLDTPAEQAFDDLVLIASQTCDTPVALVSLLDEDRQWFKARVGLDICETEIGQSVCRLEIDRAGLLEIADLAADERTLANPLVAGEGGFRFYAGAPLVLKSGAVVGRLCVIDTVARPAGLTPAQRALLWALARQVGDHLELRRIARSTDRLVELQTALIEIGEVIRRSEDSAAMISGAAAVVGRVLAVDRAGIGFVDAGVEYVDFETDWIAPGVASIAGRHRFDDYGDLRHNHRRRLPGPSPGHLPRGRLRKRRTPGSAGFFTRSYNPPRCGSPGTRPRPRRWSRLPFWPSARSARRCPGRGGCSVT